MAVDNSRSLRALDALNFCNSGIQTGLGPFIAIFYASVRHWHPGQIGIALACQCLAGVAIQPVVGHWIDRSPQKRLITGTAALIVTLAAICVSLLPGYAMQIAVQLTIGVAVTAFPAAFSAFALGLVSREDMAARIARNESMAHLGNFVFGLSAAIVGTFVSLAGIFYAAALFAFGMAVSVFFVAEEAVSFEAARAGAEGDGGSKEPSKVTDLFKDKRVLAFTAAVVLFYGANAATLPLVGQILTGGNKGRGAAWQISACVMMAEGVMVGVAAYTGRLADRWGRKPLFLIAFGALALRNVLTVVNHNKYYLISLQAFDGVAAAVYGVLLTLISADLARGTGRFNFLRSSVQSAMGLGGFLSNTVFGMVAQSMGFNASFWGLSAVAVCGGLFYQMKMPETRPEEDVAGADAQKSAA